jgi:phosphoglycerol transferase
MTQLWVKGMIDHGWYLHNPQVGAPWGLDMQDFPLAENLQFGVMKLLTWCWPDSAVVMNLYFLLTFPLTTLTTLFVFRRFRLPLAPSLVGSLLFTFLPYHFYRGVWHLFLASYYLVPLMVMVILRLYQGWIPLDGPKMSESHDKPCRIGRRELIGSIVICLLVSSAGVYYAAFACFFLLVAGLGCTSWRKSVYPLGISGLLICVIVLGTLANLSPTIISDLQNGPNPEAVVRSPSDTQLYSLDVAHMLLPIQDHRIRSLAKLAEPPETDYGTSLGLVAGAGFFLLVGRFFWTRASASWPRLLDHLSRLNVAALLLATKWGFGFFFSLALTSWIRCYYRICVYIAFFSIFAVVLYWTRLADHFHPWKKGKLVFGGSLMLILAIGILDQTSRHFVPEYSIWRARYGADAKFVQEIEALVPGGAIFQLPYDEFPEGQVDSNDALRGYLHSRTLSWSFGSMKGRIGDAWTRQISTQPPEKLVDSLALAGFQGIWLDRRAANNDSLESKLCHLLVASPLVSSDGRFSFFDLTQYIQRLRSHLSASEWEARRDSAMNPVLAIWRGGFYGHEGHEADGLRWCRSKGELLLVNGGATERQIELQMVVSAADPDICRLQIESELFSAEMLLHGLERIPFRTILMVPPGSHVVRFSCNGKKLKVPLGFRKLVFQVHDFRIETNDVPGIQVGWGPNSDFSGN